LDIFEEPGISLFLYFAIIFHFFYLFIVYFVHLFLEIASKARRLVGRAEGGKLYKSKHNQQIENQIKENKRKGVKKANK
jgi:hypothetical protein